MRKPIIGITMRTIKNELEQDIEKVSSKLIEKVKECGGFPLLIPNTYLEDLKFYFYLCDGFIIPGGYTWNKVDEEIIKYALNKDIPLLGICAGMQALANIHNFYGNYDSDRTIKIKSWIKHYNTEKNYAHLVMLDGMLKKIVGEEIIAVNSRHYNKVIIEEYFEVCAYGEDGVIEAVNIPNKRCILGVQWHPEDLCDEATYKLFNYFIFNCQKK